MYKKDFPIFENNPDLIYLDSAASAQKPKQVIQAIVDFYEKDYANIHRGLYSLSERATMLYNKAREKVKKFLNVYDSSQIIFTKSATEGINFVKYAWAERNLQEGDIILLTVMEHHANFVPWLDLAERKGIELRVVELNQNQTITAEEIMEKLDEKVKLVVLTQVSNSLGSKIDVDRVIDNARNMGIKTLVDVSQSVAHMDVNATELGADFLVFSSHKLYGPTGVGVLCLSSEMAQVLPPFLTGGDMIKEVTKDKVIYADSPARFEAGTPNIAGVIGLGAAIDYINDIGIANIELDNGALCDYAFTELNKLSEFITILGPQQTGLRHAALSFVMKDVHAHDVAQILADNNICVRAGHHCTQPLMQALGVQATVRISFGVYNTQEDVDKLVEVLKTIPDIFKRK